MAGELDEDSAGAFVEEEDDIVKGGDKDGTPETGTGPDKTLLSDPENGVWKGNSHWMKLG